MGNKKNSHNNDSTLTKLLIVKTAIDLLNIAIYLITKLIDIISK